MATRIEADLPAYSRELLDAAPDAMVIADAEGRIAMVNARVETLFGYRRDELLGRPVEVLIPERFRRSHPGHRDRYFAGPHARAMGAGGLGLVALRKDGTEFPAEISLSPLHTAHGTVAITAIRDITERKFAEEQAARLVKAQESVRMRDDFLAVASHELKTPLAALRLHIDGIGRLLGRRDAVAPDVILQRFVAVDRSVDRLGKLVDSLLDLSRISAGRLALQREYVDLVQIASTVAAAFEDDAEEARCALVVETDVPELFGTWDAMRVEQVLTNLLSNALKYGAHKPVELHVEQRPDGAARISVRDHGIGILAEDLERIFDRFERAVDDRHFAGFGLGLWISRQIVEAHGGTLTATSKRGEGSTFVMELPAADARTSPVPDPAQDAWPMVMVVDDDAGVREAIADTLADEGYRVTAHANGAEALRALREGARPDVIVLDLMMPGIDGWAFRAEQRRDPAIASVPVIVCSASGRLDESAVALGAMRCLRKPLSLDALLAAVDEAVSAHRTRTDAGA